MMINFILSNITALNGDTEGGAPVAILEAQATGLPVISSYHADIPEAVVGGKSALLAPERDVGARAQHLRVSGRASGCVGCDVAGWAGAWGRSMM
jgi:hypothetical protein